MQDKKRLIIIAAAAVLLIAVALCIIFIPDWSGKKFKVTFNTNGGSLVTEQEIKSGEKASKPTDPTKTNLTFDGWFKEEALTTPFDFSTEITSDTTVYAKWVAKVTFNTNGGGTVSEQKIIPGAKAQKPSPDPTKLGNTFAGWFKEAAFTNEFNFETEVININTTIYAKWTPNDYAVSLNANYEGAESIESKTVKFGDAYELEVPVREDYVFLGWFSAAENGTQYTGSDGKSLKNWDDVENKTLYAHWGEEVIVTVVIDDLETTHSIVKGSKFAQPAAPDKEDYTFVGWFYMDGEEEFEFDFDTVINEDIVIYAKFTPQE